MNTESFDTEPFDTGPFDSENANAADPPTDDTSSASCEPRWARLLDDVLGQLDASGRAEIERELESSAGLRQEHAQLERMAAALQASRQRGGMPESAAKLQTILEERLEELRGEGPVVGKSDRSRHAVVWLALAAAACLLMLIWPGWNQLQLAQTELAQTESKQARPSPVESNPVESNPAQQTQSARTQPAQTQSAQTQRVRTQSVHTQEVPPQEVLAHEQRLSEQSGESQGPGIVAQQEQRQANQWGDRSDGAATDRSGIFSVPTLDSAPTSTGSVADSAMGVVPAVPEADEATGFDGLEESTGFRGGRGVAREPTPREPVPTAVNPGARGGSDPFSVTATAPESGVETVEQAPAAAGEAARTPLATPPIDGFGAFERGQQERMEEVRELLKQSQTNRRRVMERAELLYRGVVVEGQDGMRTGARSLSELAAGGQSIVPASNSRGSRSDDSATPAQDSPALAEQFRTKKRHRAGRLAIIERTRGSHEQYEAIIENEFLAVREHPLSTFGVDVDTASYANVRRFLRQGSLPPAAAVRIEELINYFQYDHAQPKGDDPVAVTLEAAECPWNRHHQLVRVGLQAKEVHREERPAGNLVFLLDVSGSMSDSNKLPLLKQAMKLLVDQLTENDRIAIVTYAGEAGLKLDSTTGDQQQKLRSAIDSLHAGGSTNGSAGIELAYQKATEHFIQGGTNRVLLATDGDLNVGVTANADLVRLIQDKAESGVFLTVMGFGKGNLKDAKLEQLADNGNGHYAYLDNLREARKVLVEQMTGSLITVAKDVKIKVEFNPAEVQSYRLIGYENRVMAARDFDDDQKDSGDVGAGHAVTALYEIVPAGHSLADGTHGQSLKYQQVPPPQERAPELTAVAQSGELLTLSLRYKEPESDESTLREHVLQQKAKKFRQASPDLQFAAAVAAFGMLLRDSNHRGSATFAKVEEIASTVLGSDPRGYRTEFLDLVRIADTLKGQHRSVPYRYAPTRPSPPHPSPPHPSPPHQHRH